MTTKQADIFLAITREREYQERKYGPRQLNLATWLLILGAELGEAQQAWVKGDYNNLLCEVLQVAAVAVAMLEEYGVVERKQEPVP
jgi:NTP pyrophosphatase (non-canonical NTP hydrolase)